MNNHKSTKEDKKIMTLENIINSTKEIAIKTITYPIVGMLPAEARLKLQESKFAKKYNLDYKVAASEAQYYLQAFSLTLGVPTLAALTTQSLSLVVTSFVYTGFASTIGGAIRAEHNSDTHFFKEDEKYKRVKDEQHKYTFGVPYKTTYAPKGSIITEKPYRIYKKIKYLFSDEYKKVKQRRKLIKEKLKKRN